MHIVCVLYKCFKSMHILTSNDQKMQSSVSLSLTLWIQIDRQVLPGSIWSLHESRDDQSVLNFHWRNKDSYLDRSRLAFWKLQRELCEVNLTKKKQKQRELAVFWAERTFSDSYLLIGAVKREHKRLIYYYCDLRMRKTHHNRFLRYLDINVQTAPCLTGEYPADSL